MQYKSKSCLVSRCVKYHWALSVSRWYSRASISCLSLPLVPRLKCLARCHVSASVTICKSFPLVLEYWVDSMINRDKLILILEYDGRRGDFLITENFAHKRYTKHGKYIIYNIYILILINFF